MKIVLDARPYFASRTGLGRHIDGYYRALRTRLGKQHEIFLLGQDNLVSCIGRQVVLSFGVAAKLPRPLWEEFVVVRALEYIGADVYHIFHEGGPRKRGQWTFITHLYDVIPLIFPEWYLSSRARAGYYRYKLNTTAARANQIITCSASASEDIRRLLCVQATRLALVPTPPDNIFRPQVNENSRAILLSLGIRSSFILSVGSAEPRKNLEAVLRAYKLLLARLPDAPPLVLFGHAWRGITPNALIDQFDVGSNVIDLGPVDDSQLVALYSNALTFVYASMYEGYGLPVLEAMACGCPVIAASASSLPEVAGGAAELVGPRDFGQMADVIQNVICSSGVADSLRMHGLARVSELSWDNVVTQMLPFYGLA